MGKPKKSKKANDDYQSDDEVTESLNNKLNVEEDQISNKKNKKGRKKKDEDWEDEVSKDLQELSMQNTKNQLDEDEEEIIETQKKPKKKTKGDKKPQHDSDEDIKVSSSAFNMLSLQDSENDMSEQEFNEKKDKKKKKKEKKSKNAFEALNNHDDEDDLDDVTEDVKNNKFANFKDDDDDNNSDVPRSETPENLQMDQKAPKTKKEKKKKGKEKKEDEDIDALLADIEKPIEKESKKKKKKKEDSEEKELKSDVLDDHVSKPEETIDNSMQISSSNVDEDNDEDGFITNMTQDQIAEMMEKDLDNGFEDDKKKKKKKKKGKEVALKIDSEDEDENDDENESSTVKTAAQKKKEKKERQKLLKLQENQNKKKKGENKEDLSKHSEEKEVMPLVEMPSEGSVVPSEDKKTDVEIEEKADVEIEEKADVEIEEKADDDKTKKKKDKKKKKKGEEEEEKEKEKPKKKPSAMVRAMQEALAKQKEDEERQKREFEEKERQIELALEAKIEKERLEKERKEREKQKKKERIERQKAEGTYLTAKQKEDKARAMQMLEALKEKGVVLPAPAEDKPKKRVIYKNKHKKKFSQKFEEEESNIPEEIINNDPLEVSVEINQIEKPSEEKEDVKDEWDAESSEEDEKEELKDETTPDPETEEIKREVSSEEKAVPKIKQNEEESDDSEEESDDESEESESESESEDEKLTPAERLELAKEKARENIKKRKEIAESERSPDHLRAPIVCVLGHVDTGKTKILDKLRRTNVQDGEAGGITQQIGATNVPQHTIKEQTKMCKDFLKKELKLPGLLIIDTPGHESFSNLRNRGSSLCDIAILVVDIMHGLEPQTIESINLLKLRKTPFLVALNKVDRLFQWQPNPHSDIQNTIKKQKANTKLEFDERAEKVILEFAEQGLNTCLFYDNKNPREYISLVPTSAHSGDGMGNLIALICELCQTLLVKRIMLSSEMEAITMEVKALPGLGTTIDVILVNGKMREGETIIIAGQEGPIVTQIRGLLMPQPLKELRVKNSYEKHKEIEAAQGVKIIAKDLDKAMAGLPAYIARSKDEVEVYKEEIEDAIGDILKAIKVSELGVFVHASTIGSLEALLEFLRSSKIPFAGIGIGPIHKKDVLKASVMLEKDIQYAVILGFDIKVDRDAQEYADKEGVRIFTAEIIYHLFDEFMAFRENLKKKKQEEFKDVAVFPCKLRILPQYIFNSRDPIVVGVIVEAGFVKIGSPICVPSKEFIELGRIGSIEFNHKPIDKATKGQEVCIKIEHIGGDAPKLLGRHFDETDMLMSKISRESIDAVKDWFREEMSKGDWQLLVELKKTFQIL